ncbi:hypothetical protein D3C77_403180 [compost metagenome]
MHSLAQSLDEASRLSSGNALRHKANGTQCSGYPGHNPIPAAVPDALLRLGEMGHHLLCLGTNILIGIMGVYPVPYPLHAGVLLRLDQATHQLGVLPIAKHVGQAIMGQHFVAKDFAHPLGVRNGVRGHMQSAAVVIESCAPDQPRLGFQPQRLLHFGLGGVDLHIDTASPLVLFEPLPGNQLRLFAGQVFVWPLTLGHSLFGEQDDAIPFLLLLECVKKLVKPGTNGRHLASSRVGIAITQLHPQSGLCLPYSFIDNVGKVIIASTLILQLGNQVGFKGPSSQLGIGGPVCFAPSAVELL